MNKRGQESAFEVANKTVFFMIIAVVLGGLAIFFFWAISEYERQLAHVPPQAQAEFLALRFTHSADCFAYQDAETQQVYPNVIDIQKFTEETLSHCYVSGDRKQFNFQLVLDDKIVATDYWVGVKAFTLYRPVMVREGKQLKQKRLTINVQERV